MIDRNPRPITRRDVFILSGQYGWSHIRGRLAQSVGLEDNPDARCAFYDKRFVWTRLHEPCPDDYPDEALSLIEEVVSNADYYRVEYYDFGLARSTLVSIVDDPGIIVCLRNGEAWRGNEFVRRAQQNPDWNRSHGAGK